MTRGAPREVALGVVEAYDRWAASYDQDENPMVFMASRALEPVLATVAGERVVEFGCGTGRNLAALRPAGAARLIGLDLSPGMLAAARATGAADELLLHDMAARSPLDAGQFDHALFCLSLEHVADLRPPLAEAMRLLRPGGRLTVVEIHPFLSLSGTKAHFRLGEDEIHMPTYPHRFSDFLNVFAAIGARFDSCREWRPSDIAGPVPAKALKRGPETPIVVSFGLSRAET
jgi:malonyl-CoA O-methyltransferase